MGATGVVGGNVPLALGSALAARLEGGDQVAVVFFGDGAVQAGHFNESVNLAALWAPARDLRVREQRLRRVHAALGAHERRARERRGGALRRHARHGGRQRRGGGAATASAASWPRRARARARCCSSASPTGCAGTTRATRPTTARRWPPRTGRRRTRCCASSATGVEAGWWDEEALEAVASEAARSRRGGGELRAGEPARRSPARSRTWSTRPPPPPLRPAPRARAAEHARPPTSRRSTPRWPRPCGPTRRCS